MNTITLPPIETLAAAAAELAETAQQSGNRPLMNAINKAALELHAGTAPTPTIGGWLVESRTRSGLVHRISAAQNLCSCESAAHGRGCWHVQLLAILERAATTFTMPALAKRETDADLIDRQAEAEAAMDGLYS